MFESDFIGDFDIFIRDEWLTTFYGVSYDRVQDLVSGFSCDDGELEVRLRV